MNKQIKNILYRGLIYLKLKIMPELHIKCKIDDIPSVTTRKEFLRLYLKTMPATYYLNNREQAQRHANRSFSDLLALTKNRFPRTSLKAIIRIVAQLNIEGLCDIVWCKQIEKFVVRGRRNNPGMPFVTAYSISYYENSIGVDGISYKQLIKVREEELLNI